MHLIKIGWCHSLFSVGKEPVTFLLVLRELKQPLRRRQRQRQKTIGFSIKTITLHVHHAFKWCIYLKPSAHYDVKPPNARRKWTRLATIRLRVREWRSQSDVSRESICRTLKLIFIMLARKNGWWNKFDSRFTICWNKQCLNDRMLTDWNRTLRWIEMTWPKTKPFRLSTFLGQSSTKIERSNLYHVCRKSLNFEFLLKSS